MKKSSIILKGIIFTIAGLALLAIGIFIKFNSGKFYKSAIKTEATIVSIEDSRDYNSTSHKYDKLHDVYISYYTEDGEYFENQLLPYYTNSMREGQIIEVYYNPENPEDVRSKSGSGISFFISLGLACVFTSIGLKMLFGKKTGAASM